MAQDIFCDEGGFTGNNLLDEQQPFFAVGTVAIAPDEARELVERVIREFKIDGAELKGQRLLRFGRGRKAISSVLGALADRALVAVWHKKYALATKFFEHVFEPVLADQNSLFYGAGFHRFISNIVYLEALVDTRGAKHTLEMFQHVMKSKDAAQVPALFTSQGVNSQAEGILRDIETFVVCHHDTIAKEVESFQHSDPVFSWVLDLSFSALIALLTEWGEQHEALRVTIDESKPLYAHRGVFDVMVGREDKAYITFEDKQRSIIVNLAEPVAFGRSHDHPGIQLADVVASAANYVFRFPRDDSARTWLELLTPSLSEYCVLPDAERVDFRSQKGFVNALILYDLVQRTLQGRDLFDGMSEFIAEAQKTYYRALAAGELG